MTATPLTLPDHLEGLRVAMLALVRSAERAGLAAPVPTTPDWKVRRLIAHLGMVHRWAAAGLRGERADPDAFEREGQNAPDLLEWVRDGAIEIVTAIAEAPDDVEALVFLRDAGPPKQFWARRQCHETTIHAVDALAAALGRYPRAADADWIDTDVAVDGIDELLCGFITRSRSRLRAEEPTTVLVLPDDAEVAWSVEIGPDPAVTTRLDHPAAVEQTGDADVVLAGSAVALYLTLWNRSDEVTPQGDFGLWRDGAAVEWT